MAAAEGAPEDFHLKWERKRWETGRAASEAEGRRARSAERGSSEAEGRWMAWGRRPTFDRPGGSPWPSAAGRSAAQRGGDRWRREPGQDSECSDSLRVFGGAGTMERAVVAGSVETQQWDWCLKRKELMARSKGTGGTPSPSPMGAMPQWGSAERASSHSPEEEGRTGR